MILSEPRQIERLSPSVTDSSSEFGEGVNGIPELNLLPQERTELLDVKAWAPMLETYGLTMKVAVALTDTEGNLLGSCHNAQPIWTLVQNTNVSRQAGCPFCLSPSLPCMAVADALRTGRPTMVRDLAGLMHVAVPLSLGNNHIGAIIAGQVSDQYPESLLLERAAKRLGVSAQLLWDLSSKQRPVSRASLQLAADLKAAQYMARNLRNQLFERLKIDLGEFAKNNKLSAEYIEWYAFGLLFILQEESKLS